MTFISTFVFYHSFVYLYLYMWLKNTNSFSFCLISFWTDRYIVHFCELQYMILGHKLTRWCKNEKKKAIFEDKLGIGYYIRYKLCETIYVIGQTLLPFTLIGNLFQYQLFVFEKIKLTYFDLQKIDFYNFVYL